MWRTGNRIHLTGRGVSWYNSSENTTGHLEAELTLMIHFYFIFNTKTYIRALKGTSKKALHHSQYRE